MPAEIIGTIGTQLPLPEGVGGTKPLEAGQAPSERLSLRQPRSLGEMVADYAYITPALLYSFVPQVLRYDPLQDFVHVYKDAHPATLELPQPILDGLSGERRRWSRILYLLRKDYFLPFMAWAKTLIFVDRAAQFFVRVRPMLAQVPDVLFLSQKAVVDHVPLIEVGVLALDTNRGNILVDDAECPLGRPAKVAFSREVFSDTEVYARAVFAEDPNPEARVEESKIDPSLGLTPAEASLLERYGDREPPPRPPTIPIEQLPEDRRKPLLDFLEQARRMR